MEFIIVAGCLIVSFLVSGWTTSIMWSWFIVPLFSLPAITIPQAIGLSIILKSLSGFKISEESAGIDEILKATGKQVFMYIFILGIAWCVTRFM
jgi:hypothetical protein